MQDGQIFHRHGSWFVRYWDTVIKDGVSVRARICRRIGPYDDQHRSKKSVEQRAKEILDPINAKRVQPESTLSVETYIESYYLPHVKEHRRPSTYKGYRDICKNHLKGRLAASLRDFRCVDGDRLLASISRESSLSHTSLKHLKSFLSGAFSFAKRQGAIDGINPMMDVSIPKGTHGGDTYAYSLEEIQAMLARTNEPSRTVLAVAAFSGLRHSELRGLRWPDFTGDELRVSRTVWGRYVSEPKTRASAAPVPVLPFLSHVLGEYRKRNPGDGYIFAGPTGVPLNLANLVRRVIVPALDTCAICTEPKSAHGEGADHAFRPDAKAPKWRGWHAFRRGLATNLYRLGVRERTIQEILRHANVSTTLAFYVKPASTDSHAAMAKLEKALGNNWATEQIRHA